MPASLLRLARGDAASQAYSLRLQSGGGNNTLDSSRLLGLAAGRGHDALPASGYPLSRATAELLEVQLQLEKLERSRCQLRDLLGAASPPASALEEGLERDDRRRRAQALLLAAAATPTTAAGAASPDYDALAAASSAAAAPALLHRPSAEAVGGPGDRGDVAPGGGGPRTADDDRLTDLALASEILRGDVGVSPWQALKLADHLRRR